jgi:hypothetical protein
MIMNNDAVGAGERLAVVKAKISLLQAVEAPRVARARGSHIT